jgi:amino-acid N-acetyltransferase
MTARQVRSDEEFEALKGFLQTNKLPHEDVGPGPNSFRVYLDVNDNIIASGGIEFYSEGALLRSVAVAEPYRGRAVGRQMVNDILRDARSKSAREIFLLTETAQAYFRKIGFSERNRESVPDSVKSSTEFTSVCPTSAICMSMVLAKQ